MILLVSGMEGHVLSLTPPAVISEAQLQRAASILADVSKGLSP